MLPEPRRIFLLLMLLTLSACRESDEDLELLTLPATGVEKIEESAAAALRLRRLAYVPAYSSVFNNNRKPFNLAVTLSVRNTDPRRDLVVYSVNYHEQGGRLIRRYLANPLRLAPLASVDFFVPESDTAGGMSPSFIVEWRSAEEVTPPVLEAVMIGTASGQGISFVSPARSLPEQQ